MALILHRSISLQKSYLSKINLTIECSKSTNPVSVLFRDSPWLYTEHSPAYSIAGETCLMFLLLLYYFHMNKSYNETHFVWSLKWFYREKVLIFEMKSNSLHLSQSWWLTLSTAEWDALKVSHYFNCRCWFWRVFLFLVFCTKHIWEIASKRKCKPKVAWNTTSIK